MTATTAARTSAARGGSDGTMLQIGDRMPEFVLRDTQRNEVTQSDFEGSITVLAFYAMAFTGG